MAANLTLNQTGLPAGTTNEAREDGLATGATVTATASGYSSTWRMALLWVGQHPSPDTTSLSTWAPSGPNGYSFNPTANTYGSWAIELVTDEGTPEEDRRVLVFAIKQSASALRIPAPQERGDPTASLQNQTVLQKLRSWFNKPEGSGPFSGAGGTWAPWWRPLSDLLYRVNLLVGGIAQNAISYVTVSGTSKTLALSDAYTVQETTNGAATTITVPPSSSVAYDVGAFIGFNVIGAGQLTLAPGVGVTLQSSGSELKSARQFARMGIEYRGSDTWLVGGEKAT